MLTTQRSMSSAGKEMAQSMERLATGKKINSSSENAIAHSMSQLMTSHIQSLNSAVKNANDGIALTRSIEGAIGTLTDMLQRMRELAMQSSNGTNSNIDRSFLQEEVDLLKAEITRVAETTRYNGALVLDGNFTNKSFLIGPDSSDEIKFSVDSVASEMIGAHTYIGNGVGVMVPTTSTGERNEVAATHDLEIAGYSGRALVDAEQGESAGSMAAKINAATGETGVRADSKTLAVLAYAEDNGGESSNRNRVNINGVVTGNFVMSETFADEAVWQINQISGQTGVIATYHEDGVLLRDPTGEDITLENMSANVGLSLQKIGDDGLTRVSDASKIGAFGTNDSVRVSGTIKLSSAENFTIAQKGAKATATIKVTLGRADSYADGDYYLKNANGTRTEFTIANSTAGEFQTKIRAATGDEGFTVVGVDGGFDNGLGFQITGPKAYGDFDIYQADGTKINGGTAAAVKISNGVANSYGAGDYYIVDSGGERSNFTTTAATTSNFQAGIRAATGDNGFTVAEVDGGTNTKYDDEMKITGSLAYGDFELFKGDGTRITGNNNASIKMSLGTVDDYPAGGYYLLKDDGTQINFTTIAASAAEFQTRIRAATGDNKFAIFEADGSADGNDEIIIRPPVSYGGFNIYKSDGSQITQDKKILEVTGVSEEIKGIARPGYFAIAQDLVIKRDTVKSAVLGELSLVGDILYEGDGTKAVVVGRVDATKLGQDGAAFKINLGYEFENGDFELGAVGDTTITGWEISRQQVRLNGVDNIAGKPTPNDLIFPGTVDTNQAAPYDNDVNTPGTYTVELSSETSTGSGKSVKLKASGVNVPGYGIHHGPYLVSETAVKVRAGDEIAFDWKASGGSDAYDVLGYLVDVDTGHVEEILNQTGESGSASTSWANVSKKVTREGQYKFAFVAGTWDASGGSAAGAQLFIDNVELKSPPEISAASMQKLADRLLTSAKGHPQPSKAVSSKNSFEFRIDESGESKLNQVSDIDISNAHGASRSINVLDNALDKLSLMRSEMGATEVRLDQVISKQIGISELTSASRSRLEDADYALESAKLAKFQVLQQAGASVLVQANEITRMAIDLLKR